MRGWRQGVGLGVVLGIGLVLGRISFSPPSVDTSEVEPGMLAPEVHLTPVSVAVPAEEPDPALDEWALLPDTIPGRRYQPIGGAGLAGVDEVLALASAPSEGVGLMDAPAPAAAGSSAPAPRAPARQPAERYSAAEAARMPLLVARRGSRVLFYETDRGVAADGRGIEGVWSAVAQCGGRISLDLAQPVRQAGDLRGIGMMDESASWSWSVAVPRQGCDRSSRLWREAGRPSSAERERVEALLGGELNVEKLLDVSGVTWVSGRDGRGVRLVVAIDRSGTRVWPRKGESSEGIEVFGRYERAGTVEVWLGHMDGSDLTTFRRVRRARSGEWMTLSPTL